MTRFRRRGAIRTKKAVQNILLVFASVLLCSFVGDRFLALFGFPTEFEARYAHPPDYRETRKNIDFEYDFETNSQGLRYRDIPLEKPADTFRIFVAGDSMTEGIGVPTNARFTERLEEMFSTPGQTVDFINGGLAGTAPLDYGRIFFNVGAKYEPDALMICIFVNDLTKMPMRLSDEYMNKFLYDASYTEYSATEKAIHLVWPRISVALSRLAYQRDYQQSRKPRDFMSIISKEALKRGIEQERIDEWNERLPTDLVDAVNRREFNPHMLSPGLFNPDIWIEALDMNTQSAEKRWQSMAKVLEEITGKSRRDGLEVGVVFIPCAMQYDPARHSNETRNPLLLAGVRLKESWLTEKTEIQERLQLWAAENNTPFLDLTPTFRKSIEEGGNLNWALDLHLNEEGHRVAASAIREWIQEEDVYSFAGGN